MVTNRRLVILGVLIAGMAGALDSRSQVAGPGLDARLARATLRCAQLAELISCDEALALKPHEATALTAEADALVVHQRPGEAIGVYRNALHLAPHQAVISAKIASAEAQRRTWLKVCMTQGGEAGRHACEGAWLPGTPDEAGVFKRRGFLLRSEDRLGSLDAYMAAARLRPRDRDVAHAVLGLTDDNAPRRDPATLAARGAAFITLGRRAQAIAPLREAVDLAPTLTAARADLRLAQRPSAASGTRRPTPDAVPAVPTARRAPPETIPASPSEASGIGATGDARTKEAGAALASPAADAGTTPQPGVEGANFSNDAPAGRTN